MTALWTPIRWPAGWTETSTLDLLKGSAVDYLLIDQGATFDPIRAQAQQAGLRAGPPGEAPAGATILNGQWPSVKTAMTGGEGPWIREDLRPAAPGLLAAGTNPVNTDAVSMALMGFDPMAAVCPRRPLAYGGNS